jgi:hypothetical protein
MAYWASEPYPGADGGGSTVTALIVVFHVKHAREHAAALHAF